METTSIDLTGVGQSAQAPPPALMTIPEVAVRLGVRDRYVRRLVAERRIPFYKVGYLIRFEPSEVEAWLHHSRSNSGFSSSRSAGKRAIGSHPCGTARPRASQNGPDRANPPTGTS